MSKDTLQLLLEGDVPLTDFVTAMSNFGDLVQSLSNEIVGADEIEWEIDYLQTGSAITGIRGTAYDADLVVRVVEAFEVLSKALQDNSPIPYSDNVAKPARNLTLLVNGHIKSIRFITDDSNIAVTHPVDGVKTETISRISGETTIYGELIRVGGATPHILVRTVEGRTQSFQVNFELAKELANRLYTVVGLVGIAEWRANDLSLVSFRVNEILDYQETAIAEAVAELSKIAKRYFDDIDDVSEYVKNLRSENEGD